MHAALLSDSAVSDPQSSLVEAMLRPDFYPHRPVEVGHRETHISHVFFAGDLVYKIKKNVRYSFVDYSTLARRQFFLQQELLLNRRLAPSVYLGILPVSRDAFGWQLGGDARPIEYALVMRRLPSRRMLDYLIDRRQVTAAMMDDLADLLFTFHNEAAATRRIRDRGHPARIRKVWENNLGDLAPFVGRAVDARTLAAVGAFGRGFLDEHFESMLERARAGRTREVHGDLHCEHVCFAPEGIQIFDCVEFSYNLRCLDVASEIAFLTMDLQARGAASHARRFLDRYLARAQDPEIVQLLPFYQCYRALVRGKVYALLFQDQAEQASRYFDLAYSYTWERCKPFVVIVAGLTGTGKSTLARALGRRLGAAVISSDLTRKRLAGDRARSGPAPYEHGIYTGAMTARAYRKIIDEAEKRLAAGEGVVLDATFQKAAHRRAVLEAAARRGASVALVYCHARASVTQKRLARRALEQRDVSDGNWDVYLKQKERFEPITESAPRLAVDTEAPVAVVCEAVERFLRETFSTRPSGASIQARSSASAETLTL